MKLNHKVLLTVGREYGSGGRVISETLGKDLSIPVFDKNMISMIAKEHGLNEDILTSSDERRANPFFESYSPYGTGSGSVSDQLFLMQSKIIREEADKGSAIFVGRCADEVLREYDDVIRIFIFAPRNDRIKRIMQVEDISDVLAADKIVKRTDKARKSYYQFYTDRKWGSADGMDLLINSSALGIEKSVLLIEDFLRHKGYLED